MVIFTHNKVRIHKVSKCKLLTIYTNQKEGKKMRKNSLKRCFSLLISLALVLTMLPFGTPSTDVYADEISIEASLDAAVSSGAENDLDTHVNAGLPSRNLPMDTIDNPYVVDGDSLNMGETLPAKYIPELKDIPHNSNQDNFGTCYAFASIGTTEASAIHQGISVNGISANSINASEEALAYFTTHTVTDPLGGGKGDSNAYSESSLRASERQGKYNGVESGNPCFSIPVLANWTGATDEKDVPYTGTNPEAVNYPVYVAPEYAYNDILHIQQWASTYVGETIFTSFDENGNVSSIDDEEFTNARNTLKSMIQEFGGATISYSANDGFLGSDNHSYFNYEDRSLNHFVTVLGWDDDYSKDNFNASDVRPRANGAWLCRNSWTGADYVGNSIEENLSIDSLFYLSYYDTSIIDAYAVRVEPADNYYNNYQYDLAVDYAYSATENVAKAANVFTVHAAEAGEELKAVSFTTNGCTDMDYEINIYRNPNEDNPESGTLVESAKTTGKTSYVGYYTVPLTNSVKLVRGEEFAVVITLKKQGEKPGFSVEFSGISYNPQYWFQSTIGIEPHTSFMVDADGLWYDMIEDYYANDHIYGNVRIKAFTDNLSDDEVNYSDELKSISVKYTGDKSTLVPGAAINKNDFKITKHVTRTYPDLGEVVDLDVDLAASKYDNVSINPATVPENPGDYLRVKVSYTESGIEVSRTVKIKLNDKIKFEVDFKDDIDTFEYTGKAIKPEISVKYNDILLKNNKDYTISYKNNINVPNSNASAVKKPYILIKGKGNFKSSVKVPFEIVAKSISSNDIAVKTPTVLVNDKKTQKPAVGLKLGKKNISKKNYSLSYLDKNKNALEGNVIPKGAIGEYYIRVTGKNNFNDTLDIPINIGRKKMSSVKVALFTDSTKAKQAKSFIYNGTEIEPAMTVTAKINGKLVELKGDKTTVSGNDFTYKYEKNNQIGTATLTLTGTNGENEFVGEKTVSFKITGKKLSDVASFSVSGNSFTYTGKEIKPAVTVTAKDGITLTENVDYAISYKNNVNAGKAQVIISAKGKYTGKYTKTFNILPIEKDDVIVALPQMNYLYVKGGVKPAPVVRYKGVSLVSGKDYTVSYVNSDKASTNTNYAKCIVKLKGNFNGTITKNYIIYSSEISEARMTYSYAILGDKLKNTKIVLKDSNGKTLKEGTDFEKDNFYYADYNLLKWVKLEDTAVATEGVKYSLVIKGKGNYSSSMRLVIKTGKYDFSKAKIKTKNNPQYYTGSAITPSPDELISQVAVKAGGKTVTLNSSDYRILSYANNVKPGKAIVTIEGLGNYVGIKTITFNIVSGKFE